MKRYLLAVALALGLIGVTVLVAQTILQPLWVIVLGGNSSDRARAVAVDPSGDTITVGSFQGTTIQFGTSAGGQDIFLVKHSPEGAVLWSKAYGGVNSEVIEAVAVDGSGVAVTGYLSGDTDLGGGLRTSFGGFDIFVAKYDTNGDHLWSRVIGGLADDTGRSVAMDSNSDVILTGDFRHTIDFGLGPITPISWDTFLMKMDGTTGTTIWARNYLNNSLDWGRGVAVDPNDNIGLTGIFGGTIDFDGGAAAAVGGFDVYFLQADPNGVTQWDYRVGSAADEFAYGVDFTSSSEMIGIGTFRDTVDFDPNTGAVNVTANGTHDIFVLKITEAGDYGWVGPYQEADPNIRETGSVLYDLPHAVHVDPNDNVYFTGAMRGSTANPANYGGSDLVTTGTGAGDVDVMLVQLDPNGVHTFSYNWGSGTIALPVDEQAFDLTVDGESQVVLVGITKSLVTWLSNAQCTALDTPYGCCSGAGTGSCTTLTTAVLGASDGFLLTIDTDTAAGSGGKPDPPVRRE